MELGVRIFALSLSLSLSLSLYENTGNQLFFLPLFFVLIVCLVKHGRSSCESDLVLSNGNYDGELAKEHEEFSGEIYGMVNADYSYWEKWWKEIKLK